MLGAGRSPGVDNLLVANGMKPVLRISACLFAPLFVVSMAQGGLDPDSGAAFAGLVVGIILVITYALWSDKK